MESGIEQAKRLLVDIRLLSEASHGTPGVSLTSVAGMIERSIPPTAIARAGFYLALAEYLTSAIEGAALDVASLGASPYITLARQVSV